MSDGPILQGGRILLRPPIPSDVDSIVALLGNDRHAVEQTAAIPWPVTRESTLAWITMSPPPGMLRWSVLLRPEGTLVGAAGGTLSEHALSIGYWMGAPYRCQGYTREAVGCVIAHAQSLGKREVTAEVFAGNAGSANLLLGLGFLHISDAIRDYPVRGGPRTTHLYRMTLVAAR